MPTWVENSLIVTSEDWQLSQPVIGDYVRITHQIMNAPDPSDPDWRPYPFYGLIAQAEYNPFTLFGVRRLWPSLNRGGQIFYFPDTPATNDRRIAIRGDRRWKTDITWICTVWSTHIPLVDLALAELAPGQTLNLSEATLEAIAIRVAEEINNV